MLFVLYGPGAKYLQRHPNHFKKTKIIPVSKNMINFICLELPTGLCNLPLPLNLLCRHLQQIMFIQAKKMWYSRFQKIKMLLKAWVESANQLAIFDGPKAPNVPIVDKIDPSIHFQRTAVHLHLKERVGLTKCNKRDPSSSILNPFLIICSWFILPFSSHIHTA